MSGRGDFTTGRHSTPGAVDNDPSVKNSNTPELISVGKGKVTHRNSLAKAFQTI